MGAKGSIIIPAFNEAGRLGATLEQVVSFFDSRCREAEECEVIVVCDGCEDDTEAIAQAFVKRLPLRLISYANNRGKGYAVRAGVAASSGRVVAFMDADGATPVEEWSRLSKPILAGEADVVVGSRRAKGAVVALPQSWLRQLLGRLFARAAQVLLGLKVLDTQCGFKVFDGDWARVLFKRLSCDGFAFDLEVLAEAKERGLRVVERGVEWHEVPGSTVHPLRDGLRMLKALWQIRQRLARRRLSGAAEPARGASAAVAFSGGSLP